jgi:non-specific serine/threonine protein kinase/serine/threonine-protein kinase
VIVEHPELIAGRYRIAEPLGRGGMGTVYACHDLRLDRDVAVKVLRDDLTRDPSLRRRFEREARAAARVSHPHAVAIYDTGEDEARDTFIVMERLSGRTLGHELAEGPLDEARLREVADAVLGALGAAHEHGLVHRDVKPGNILLTDDGTFKVCDFGIATSLDAGDTTTRVPLGTPAYTAPERLRGFSATARSDLYALGVVLYEAAAGSRPFVGDGAVAVAEAVVAGTHTDLHERRPDLSPAFVATVERALATDPAERFADADQMRAAFDAPTSTAGTSTAGAPAAPTVPLRPPARDTAILPAPARGLPTPRRDLRRAIVVVSVVLLLVAAIMIALLVAAGDDTPTTAPTTAPATTPATTPATVAVELPAPLAHALEQLERATQP